MFACSAATASVICQRKYIDFLRTKLIVCAD